MKKCIFYLPYKLDDHASGARMLRPRKMIQAFRDIGYEVFVIEGTSRIRRQLIEQVKQRINSGDKYDFMYSESHTEPTLLTNPNHMPTHPFLDFGFFRYVKKQGIPIGLFYCDIYWKFESYGTELPAWKRLGALLCYRYDIRQYQKYLDRFYVPDTKVCDYLQCDSLTAIADELLPGCDDLKVNRKTETDCEDRNQHLHIFYVGGLGSQYKISELLKAILPLKDITMTICCREWEWEAERKLLEPLITDRVQVVHRNSGELEDLYAQADICSLMFEGGVYRQMAKPFKAFEYLAHEKPSLVTEGTAIGEFVRKNQIGWVVPFTSIDIEKSLKDILTHPEELKLKSDNCTAVKKQNLWSCRADKVVRDLVKT